MAAVCGLRLRAEEILAWMRARPTLRDNDNELLDKHTELQTCVDRARALVAEMGSSERGVVGAKAKTRSSTKRRLDSQTCLAEMTRCSEEMTRCSEEADTLLWASGKDKLLRDLRGVLAAMRDLRAWAEKVYDSCNRDPRMRPEGVAYANQLEHNASAHLAEAARLRDLLAAMDCADLSAHLYRQIHGLFADGVQPFARRTRALLA